jgi:hypothetical protein
MKEIIEGNKLIAEFIGYQILHKKYQYRSFNSSNESYFEESEGDIVCDKNGDEVNLYLDGDPLFDLSELPFHSSWDLLMPVVEKCLTIPHEGNLHMKLNDALLTLNIKEVWLVVIEFIEWYNKNK